MKLFIPMCGLLFASNAVMALDESSLLIPSEAKFSQSSFHSSNDDDIKQAGSKDGVFYFISHLSSKGEISANEPGLSIEELSNHEQSWEVGCNKDLMDDTVNCFAILNQLFIMFSESHGAELTILDPEEPRKEISNIKVRVDKGAVQSRQSKVFSVAETKQILDSINEGSQVDIRYYDPVTDGNVDTTLYVYNMNIALDYLKWVISVANR